MLDQLNLKPIASNVRAWIVDAYLRKMIEIKYIFASIMVSVKVEVCIRRKYNFIEIIFRAAVNDSLRIVTTTVKELHERTTAVAIRRNIVNCLATLRIWRSKFTASR